MDFNDIKLIASDLDGTLIDKDKTISDELRSSFEKLKDKGVIIVIATGRGLDSLTKEQLNIGFSYYVTSNGAKIYDKNKKEIYKKTLNKSFIKNNYGIIFDKNLYQEIFIEGKAYVQDEFYYLKKPFGRKKEYIDYFKKTRIPVKNLKRLIETNIDNIENINLIFDNDYKKIMKRELQNLLKEKNNFSLTESFYFNLELGNKNTNKGAAIKYLAKINGLCKKNILSFGDNHNDLSMIESSKYKGVIKNSPLSNLVDVKTKNNLYLIDEPKDNGVLNFLNELVTFTV